MPAISASQWRAMAAALHGANFPLAEQLRQSMGPDKLREFVVGTSPKDLPVHVKKKKGMKP